jgi:hypothetical protein
MDSNPFLPSQNKTHIWNGKKLRFCNLARSALNALLLLRPLPLLFVRLLFGFIGSFLRL